MLIRFTNIYYQRIYISTIQIIRCDDRNIGWTTRDLKKVNFSNWISFTDQTYNTTNTFIASDGIPFTITNDKFNGKRLIYFNCATNHNLEVGEFVEITIPSNTNGFGGVNIFSVYSLGNGKYDSESNV